MKPLGTEEGIALAPSQVKGLLVSLACAHRGLLSCLGRRATLAVSLRRRLGVRCEAPANCGIANNRARPNVAEAREHFGISAAATIESASAAWNSFDRRANCDGALILSNAQGKHASGVAAHLRTIFYYTLTPVPRASTRNARKSAFRMNPE